MNTKLRNTVLIIASVVTVLCVIIGSVGVNTKIFNAFSGLSFAKSARTDAQSLDGDVKEIHLDLDLANIKIKKGSENTISISNNKSEKSIMTFENGILTVECKEDVKLSPFSRAASDVEITLSNDVDIIDVVCSVGDFEVSDITAKEFKSSLDMGDVDIKKCKFDNMDLSSDLGDIKVRDVEFSNGNVTSSAGDVDLELSGMGNDVAFDIAVDLGDVEINGKEVDNHYKTTDGTKELSVSLNMGDLDIRY